MTSPSKSRVIKLQDGETVEFLELYRSEKVLYDPTDEKYKDREARMAAAARISKTMKIPGFGPKEVIYKFKNLRSSYCQELKKISDSERSGDVYVPKVFWFDLMNSFIRPFVQQRYTISNLVKRTVPSSPSISHEEESQEDDAIDSSEMVPLCIVDTQSLAAGNTIKTTQTGNAEHTKTLKRKDAPDACPSNIKQNVPNPVASSVDGAAVKLEEIHSQAALLPVAGKVRKCTSDPSSSLMENSQESLVGFLNEAMEKLEEISNRAALRPKEDSYDCFGKYVSCMLREIGPPLAMRLQEQITRLITQAMCPTTTTMIPCHMVCSVRTK